MKSIVSITPKTQSSKTFELFNNFIWIPKSEIEQFSCKCHLVKSQVYCLSFIIIYCHKTALIIHYLSPLNLFRPAKPQKFNFYSPICIVFPWKSTDIWLFNCSSNVLNSHHRKYHGPQLLLSSAIIKLQTKLKSKKETESITQHKISYIGIWRNELENCVRTWIYFKC